MIPFSVKGDKAVSPWVHGAMLNSTVAANDLRPLELGPALWRTYNTRNFLWLLLDVCTYYGEGQMNVVPVLSVKLYMIQLL